MLFNSVDFAIFLPLVFILYWTVFRRSIRMQNAFVLLASMVFYGWWDWRYLALVFFNATVDYFVGIKLYESKTDGARKRYLAFSLIANLGMLGFFKYYDFFIMSFNDAFSFFGQPLNARTLNLVLPIGISFYTFQTMSYTIDIYRKKLTPARDPIAFGAYVLFFPQLVAGPIERATRFLPQFFKAREFDIAKARDGIRQLLWGLFKKIVIADNCADYVNLVFASPEDMTGATMFLGVIFFSFQVYGDFSGYSDIALGSARLLGFNLMRNFHYPFFSRDIAEFWQRWHVSLNTWFRDYLYIPLGGSRKGRWHFIMNVLIIFVVSGVWHGAAWTYVVWGFLSGLFFLPIAIWGNKKRPYEIAQGRWLPTWRDFGGMVVTFGMFASSMAIFRAESFPDAITIYQKIFSATLFEVPLLYNVPVMKICVLSIGFMLLLEWFNRNNNYGLELDTRIPKVLRFGLYYGVVALLIAFAPMSKEEFIYFQF